ncbi:MAG: energy transducer TonB [Prevotella sp.]|nr:energy transducer TonB [Prevotella sp.]
MQKKRLSAAILNLALGSCIHVHAMGFPMDSLKNEPKICAEPSVSYVQHDSLKTEKVTTGTKNPNVFGELLPMPKFPGDLLKFIADNLQYPPVECCIQGRVVVKFFIAPDGTCSQFTILRSVDPLLDKEALRVLRLMPKWNCPSGMKGGMWFTVPVTFRLS